jgi:hypothetical protein
MGIPVADMLTLLADASSASSAMRDYVLPLMGKLIILASAIAVFFVVYGGIQHITSSGDPEKLDDAKRTIRNALIGLTIVVAAATFTGILNHAYNSKTDSITERIPKIEAVEPAPPGGGANVVLDIMIGIFRNIIETSSAPVLALLGHFTKETPLMADNSGVFNVWLAIVGIADVLFILILALIGFHVMSFSSLGFKELDLKHLLPQIVVGFLLINSSIFLIDTIISLSNAMIDALNKAFSVQHAWEPLKEILGKSATFTLFILVVMVFFVALALALLVYYVVRIVALYVGAVLSPLIFLLWVLPSFRDFAYTAIRVYLSTIFVLFVHVVILLLASSLFKGVRASELGDLPNALMSLVLGIATLWSLLKTQSVMSQLTYASQGASAGSILARKIVQGFAAMGVAAFTKSTKGRSGDNGNNNNGNNNNEGSQSSGKPTPPENTRGLFYRRERYNVGQDQPPSSATKSRTNTKHAKKTGETVQASPPPKSTPRSSKPAKASSTKSRRKST